MLTRSVARDYMARAVFEQPPSSTRRDSAKISSTKNEHENENDTEGF